MNIVAQKIAKNSFYNFINNAINILCALALSIFAARFLGPIILGKYGLVSSAIAIIGLISNLGLTQVTTKYIAEFAAPGNELIRRQIISYVSKIRIGTSLIVMVIILFSANFFANFYSDNSLAPYLIISSLYILPSGLANLFGNIFAGMQEYKYIALRTSLLYPINVIAMFIVLKLGFGLMGFIWVNVIYGVVECIFYFILLKRKTGLTMDLRLSLPTEIKKRVFSYNWQVALIVLLNYVVWQRSEVFFLGKFQPVSETGFYSLAYGIIEKVQVFLPSIFAGVLMPAISELYGKQQIDSIRKVYFLSTRYLLFLTLPITVEIICVSKQIIPILYGKAYLPMIPVLNILLISGCFAIIASAGFSVLYGIENQNFLLKWTLLMTFVNLALDLILIPKFAAVGAALANSITQIVAILGILIKVSSVLSGEFPLKDFFKAAIASSVMAISSLWIMHFSNRPLILIFSVIIGVGCYLSIILLTRFFSLLDLKLLGNFKKKIPHCIYVPLEGFLSCSLKTSAKELTH